MNGSSIELGKEWHCSNYCSKDVSVANMEETGLTSYERKKERRKLSFWPVYYMIDAIDACSPFDPIGN